MRIKKFNQFSLNENTLDDEDFMKPEKTAESIVYKLVKNFTKKAALFKNIYTNKFYLFIYAEIEESEFYSYAEFPWRWEYDDGEKYKERDTSSFDFDEESIENYLNDNLEYLQYGESISDYLDEEANFLLIDDPEIKLEIGKILGINIP